ncbi:MAG: hypothetical protein FJ313_02250 [Gemmatimonadetes bacterium]|nr:hypothetical protein [Gemmatimonadota bacterium]
MAVIDTREQAPLNLAPLRTVRGTLETGDYSILGLEHIVAVERKSLSDLVACVGRERERFERELQRLLAYPVRAMVVEAFWADLEGGAWRGEVRPAAVTGSVLSWIAAGIPVLLAGDRRRAALAVRGILWHAARHRLRELLAFANTLRTEEDDATQLGCPDRSACP